MEIDKNLYDCVVIGGGPAGLTAGIYLARAKYRVLIIEKETFGGQITITSEVVNYPGIEKTSGKALTDGMRKQAENFGAEFLLAEVTKLNLDDKIRTVTTDKGEFKCFSLIVATGAHPRTVGFNGELDFRGHGVAYCATCDGEFFTGKKVFVVGGGFAAAEEAVFLTKYASSVTILIRGDDFKCAKQTADEARNHPKITVLTNTTVEEVRGDVSLKSITYKNTKTGEITTYESENNDTFGVFVFAGYAPSTELIKGLIELDEQGYVKTDAFQKTNIDGVYAAGDVCIKNLRQVVTATRDGAIAATEAEKYCALMQKETNLKPLFPEKIKRTADDAPKTQVQENADDDIFSQDVKDQLNMVFERMQSKLILKAHLNDSVVSGELEEYMNEISKLTDKVIIEKVRNSAEAPCVRICREDGSDSGLAFHGVPGGHELQSFVLGMYNVAGPGQPLDDAIREKINSISNKVHFDIMVSLSCTMCPDLVVAAQRIAALNENVSVDVYDLNHFPEMKDKYNVMSVPCFVINDGSPMFGKKKIDELLSLIVA